MPTKRNDIKEFAIGTKIEYNGKLYRVVKNDICFECSISDICLNCDKEHNTDNCLTRHQRINIFGECSCMNRTDDTSVIFKEIQEDKKVIANDKVRPLYADSNENQLRGVEFDIPKGFSIDKENSDLDKGIIKFKANWLTLDQLYKLAKDNVYFTNRDAIKDFANGKMVVLANLMDIARYFNGDWNYNVTKEEDIGYVIVYDGSIQAPNYSVRKIEACSNIYFGNVVFKNKDYAQYVIDNPNFRNILDIIFKS